MNLPHSPSIQIGRQLAANSCFSAPRSIGFNAIPASSGRRRFHSSRSQWGKGKAHRRVAQLGGSVVRDSLDDTLAAHKGLNRIRMMYSPRLEARDEQNDRISARLRGIESLPAAEPVARRFFQPLNDGGKTLNRKSRQTLPPNQADKSRMMSKGSRNTGPDARPPSIALRYLPDPNQLRVHDPTTPEIDWRRPNARGLLPCQCPWLEYMKPDMTSNSKHRLCQELIAYREFAGPTPAEHQAHSNVEELVTLKLLQHLDASVSRQAGFADISGKRNPYAPSLSVPHSDVTITLRPTDPAKREDLPNVRGPSATRPLMHRLSLNLLKQAEDILKSTEHFGDGNGNCLFENVRLTNSRDPYVAARHVPTGLRVVITTSPKLMKRSQWVDSMLIDNVPSLPLLYTAFRNYLDLRNLFDPGDTDAMQATIRRQKGQSSTLKLARGLNHYTLSALLIAAFELTRRSTRRPTDIADHFLDVLNFLADIDMAKYCISIDPPLLIPVGSDTFKALKLFNQEPDRENFGRDPKSANYQYVEARYRILDPIDPRWDLGASISLSRVIKRAFKGWQNDIALKMDQWDHFPEKRDALSNEGLLQALGTDYEPFESWRDNLLIQGTRVGSDLRLLRQSVKLDQNKSP